MEFTELMQKRESVRSYDPARPVDRDIIDHIIETAALAPSAVNRQPWKFLVLDNGTALEAVRECYHRPWFKDAPCVIVITGRTEWAWSRSYDGYNSLETDHAIVMTCLQLAASDQGLASCWIQAFDPARLRDALKLEPLEKVFSITPLGYPLPDYKPRGSKERKKLEEIRVYL